MGDTDINELLDPRSQVNEKLIKIKQEHDLANTSISSYDSDEMSHIYDDFSQAPRPQRFYQDLDNQLSDLTRDQYINEIITLCSGDYENINDYRVRLAERARGFPECPDTRLVNRRNTANSTKVAKCANDCYVLHMFNNGERSKEINEVFSSVGNNTMNDSLFKTQLTNSRRPEYTPETSNINAFVQPEITSSIIQLQAEIKKITEKQQKDSEILKDIRSDMREIAGNVRLVYGATKSILSKMPEMSEQSKVDKLQNDVAKISSTLGVLNKKINDQETSNLFQSKSSVPELNGAETSHINYAEALNRPAMSCPISNAAVMKEKDSMQVLTSSTPARKMLSTEERTKHVAQSINNELKSNSKVKGKSLLSYRKDAQKDNTQQAPTATTSDPQQKQVHVEDKTETLVTKSQSGKQAQFKTGTGRKQDQDEHAGFTAVRRKKIVSYHISNIDSGVSVNEIYNYMYEKKVYCTNIRVYYGKMSASARVNIHESDTDIVEEDSFWPEEIICRKWQSKTEWEAELDKRQKERQQRRNHQHNRYNYWGNNEYEDNDNYYDHDAYNKIEQADRDKSEKWWQSWGSSDNRRQSDIERNSGTYNRY